MTRLPLSALALLSATAAPALAGDLNVFTSDEAGFLTHSFWYDDGTEITVVDSQFTPRTAELLIAEIRAATDLPITRVIVTHPNADKFNGLSAFRQAGAQSIASEATVGAMPAVHDFTKYFWVNVAGAFTEETYPMLSPIDVTFERETTITLGSGETLSLIELDQPGVATNQTVVRIDDTSDLIVGDLVHSNNHAWLAGGLVDGRSVPTLDAWKTGLAQLPELGTGTVYGGRGDFLPVDEAVAQQTAYLAKAGDRGLLRRGARRRARGTDGPGGRPAALRRDPGRAGRGVPGLRLPGPRRLQRLRPREPAARDVKTRPPPTGAGIRPAANPDAAGSASRSRARRRASIPAAAPIPRRRRGRTRHG